MKRFVVLSISLVMCLIYAAAVSSDSLAAAKKSTTPKAKPAAVTPATKLNQAAAKGDVALIAKLLKADPSLVKAKDKDGSTALHWAVDKKQKASAEALLSAKADVNAKKNNGVTPLHVAAARGDAKIVGLLLDKGADPNIKDNVLRTPMTVARDNKHDEIVDVLAAAAESAKPKTPDAAPPPAPVSTYKPTPIVPPETVALAKKMVTSASTANFAEIENSYDEKMKTLLEPGKLKEMWDSYVKRDGAFQRIVQSVARTNEMEGQKYSIISVDCQFEKTRRSIEVTITADNKIRGFFFVPLSFDE